jgi:hypothetical protein
MIDYGRQKLIQATESLATGTGSMNDRLANVWISHLHQIKPAEDLPGGLVDDFLALEEECTRHGSFDDSIARIGEDSARSIAAKIVNLAFALDRIYLESLPRRGEDL